MSKPQKKCRSQKKHEVSYSWGACVQFLQDSGLHRQTAAAAGEARARPVLLHHRRLPLPAAATAVTRDPGGRHFGCRFLRRLGWRLLCLLLQLLLWLWFILLLLWLWQWLLLWLGLEMGLLPPDQVRLELLHVSELHGLEEELLRAVLQAPENEIPTSPFILQHTNKQELLHELYNE